MSILSHGDVPGGLLVKNPPSIAVDTGSIPDQGTNPICHGVIKPTCCNKDLTYGREFLFWGKKKIEEKNKKRKRKKTLNRK